MCRNYRGYLLSYLIEWNIFQILSQTHSSYIVDYKEKREKE